MRRHLLLIAMILGIAFLVYKFESVSVGVHPRPVALDDGVVVAPRPTFAPGDHVSPARATLSPTPPTGEDPEAESKCWATINDQLRTNGYLDSIRPKLNAIVGPWFYEEEKTDLKTDETSTAGRFFQALAEGGMLEGRSLEENHAHALKVLRDVANDDRDNAAPLLFAAALAEKDGDKATADQLYEEAKGRSRFHTYVTDLTRAVVGDMQSVGDWFEAAAVNSRIPVPQMTELSKFLKARDSARFATMMIRNYPFDKEKPVSDIDFFPLEYAFGMSILKAVDPKSATLFPEYKVILRKSFEANSEGEPEEFWTHPTKFGCDINVMKPWLASYQARLRPQN